MPNIVSESLPFRLVSTNWVFQHQNDLDLRIVDTRPDVHSYLHSHLPNAVHIPDCAVRTTRGNMPVQYLDPPEMANVFSRAGIGNNTHVAFYSSGEDVLGSTMLAYCLQRLGHQFTMVMDGGYDDYRNRHSLTQQYPKQIKSQKYEVKQNNSLSVTHEEVIACIGDPEVIFLDARPSYFYLGNTHQWMRNGHIPGAISFDWRQLVYSDASVLSVNSSRFRPVEEMRDLLLETGIKTTNDVIIYCGTSREASLLFEVVRNILHYKNTRLYEGSMTEWSSFPDYPIETEGRVVQPAQRSASTCHESELSQVLIKPNARIASASLR